MSEDKVALTEFSIAWAKFISDELNPLGEVEKGVAVAVILRSLGYDADDL